MLAFFMCCGTAQIYVVRQGLGLVWMGDFFYPEHHALWLGVFAMLKNSIQRRSLLSINGEQARVPFRWS